MAKLTRKQYTRKRLFAGIVIFASVALVVTGVAVGLLFGSLSESAGGNLQVSQVAVSPMSFNDLRIDGIDVKEKQTINDAFIFDSQYGDDSGRVCWNGESYEKLKITVSGVVLNAQYLGKFSYVLELPQGVLDAAAKGYIDISDYYDAEAKEFKKIDVSLSECGAMLNDGATTVWRFSFDISLKWGEKFNNINPSVYYDTDGLDIPHEELVKTLEDLRTTVMGTSFMAPKPSFTLTLTVSPNQ